MITESEPTPRSGRLPRAERRKQLLAAAQSVFIANGYHAAAMDDIASEAGVSKPVLYQHFPGKLELYLALIDEQAEALVGAIRRALSETSDNQERVHGVLSTFFNFVEGAEGGSPGAFRLIFETDLGNDPAVRERVDRVSSEIMHAVADTVSADTGLDRVRAELLAMVLTGGAQIVARWWLNADRPIPKDEAVALVESLQWRGISNFPLFILEQQRSL
ncbi:transcriptional regulator, TetR family [Frankineae bacterium MT45]|nr:transcriptional regulator, TetR family [Frankineae bacterium MT45]